jgi:hypothetical protein
MYQSKKWNARQLSDGPAAVSSQKRSECSNLSVYVPYIYLSRNRWQTEDRGIEKYNIGHHQSLSLIGETHPKIGDRQQSGIYPFSGSQFRYYHIPFNQRVPTSPHQPVDPKILQTGIEDYFKIQHTELWWLRGQIEASASCNSRVRLWTEIMWSGTYVVW